MKLAQNSLVIATLVTSVVIQTSCATMEPTPAETAQTNANIYREQSALSRESAFLREQAGNQEDLAQGLGVGSDASNALEAEAARTREEADNLDTASRQMGRGAAN
jgi:hypothetical protein